VSDLRSLLERADRAVARLPDPFGELERIRDRLDRRRRNQRVTAGVVGLALFLAAGWIVANGVSDDPTPRPGVTGPVVPRGRVGIVGVPPEGAVPSLPETGQALLRAHGRCVAATGAFCRVWLYADGRVIWNRDGELPYGANELTTGLLEQRLTTHGIELLRAAFLATGGCDRASQDGRFDCFPPMPGPAPFPPIPMPGWEDPSWGLPAGAWAEPEIKGFVPSRFAMCFQGATRESVSDDWYDQLTWGAVEPARVMTLLPSSAAELLGERDPETPPAQLHHPAPCYTMTIEEARSVVTMLGAASEWDQISPSHNLEYRRETPDGLRQTTALILPIMPNGEWVRAGGG
jgi:hypothetical protein